MTGPEYVTLAFIANTFQISVETARLWLLDGKFPNYIRPGRKYLVPMSDLDALLQDTFGEGANQQLRKQHPDDE